MDVMSSEMCGVMGEDDNKHCLTLFSQPSRAKFVCPQYKSTKKKNPTAILTSFQYDNRNTD